MLDMENGVIAETHSCEFVARARFIIVTILMAAGLGCSNVACAAGWSPPVNLSNTPGGVSRYPSIAADPWGHAHVVWVEAEMAGETQEISSAIYYSMFSGATWTQPVDIVYGQYMLLPSIAVDPDGGIHVLYNQGGSLFYVQASVANTPWSARNWSDPRPLYEHKGQGEGAKWMDLQSDPEGDLHLVYSNLGTVYYQRSDDGGRIWSDPVSIPPYGRAATIQFSNVNRLAVDSAGSLYVAWGEEPVAPSSTEPSQVYFSKSTDQGQTWIEPLSIRGSEGGKRLFEPITIVADGDDRIHLLWRERDSAGALHVWHRWSTDGGDTWSTDEPFCGGNMLRYGGISAARDSLGRVHLVYAGGASVNHAMLFDGNGCASDESIITPVRSVSPYWPRLAIGLGNQAQVVWTSGFPELGLPDLDARLTNGEYEIQFSSSLIDSPALQPEVVAKALVPAQPIIAGGATASRQPQSPVVAPTETAIPAVMNTSNRQPFVDLDGTRSERLSPGQTITVGVLPVLGILLITVMLRRVRKTL